MTYKVPPYLVAILAALVLAMAGVAVSDKMTDPDERQASTKKIWDDCAPVARLKYPECDVVRSGKLKGTWID